MAPSTDSATTSVRGAIQALAEGRPVLALESTDLWGEITAIEAFQEDGRITPAYRLRFASGHSRVTPGGERFRIGSRGLQATKHRRDERFGGRRPRTAG